MSMDAIKSCWTRFVEIQFSTWTQNTEKPKPKDFIVSQSPNMTLFVCVFPALTTMIWFRRAGIWTWIRAWQITLSLVKSNLNSAARSRVRSSLCSCMPQINRVWAQTAHAQIDPAILIERIISPDLYINKTDILWCMTVRWWWDHQVI